MAKVTSPSTDFKYYKSSRGRLTLVKDRLGNYSFKKYNRPSRIDASFDIEIKRTVVEKAQGWAGLSQSEKDAWNTKAQPLFMTGRELYINQGFKEGNQSRYGLGIYGQARYIKSP